MPTIKLIDSRKAIREGDPLKNNQKIATVGVSLLALALAAGCTDSKSQNSSSSGGASSPAVKQIDINAQPRSALQTGGTVIWALDQFSTQWNWNHLNGTEASTKYVIDALLPEPLIADKDANVTANPDYLTSATLTSKNPQTVEYKINPKAKWSDGQPMSVRDFVAQWQATNGRNEAYQVSSTTGYEDIASVTAGPAGPSDVIVKFAKPFSDWKSLFAPLYPASARNTPTQFNKGWLNRIPVTAGPFKFSRFDKTAQTVTVVRDPKWWGTPPLLDRIVFKSLESTASIQAYVNGEIDYLPNIAVNPSDYKLAKAAKGGTITEAAGPDFRHFTFSGTSPILSDVNVRRAIAMGTDRKAIATADLKGLNWPVVVMNNHFFVNTQAGYQDTAGNVGTYNPTEARKLLDAAGWTIQGQYRQKAGKPLTLRFVIPSGIASSKNEGELFLAMMKQIGVKVAITPVASNDFFDKYVSTGNFDVTPFSWLGTPFPVSSAKSIYLNPTKDSKGELQIQQNFARVGSPQLDALLKRAGSTLDIDASRALINQADRMVWQEVHSLTLFQRPQISGVKNGLANLGSPGFSNIRYPEIGYQK